MLDTPRSAGNNIELENRISDLSSPSACSRVATSNLIFTGTVSSFDSPRDFIGNDIIILSDIVSDASRLYLRRYNSLELDERERHPVAGGIRCWRTRKSAMRDRNSFRDGRSFP